LAEALEEPSQSHTPEMREEQLIHADLDPMFTGFGPSMFG
jgi:hypothetical protein